MYTQMQGETLKIDETRRKKEGFARTCTHTQW